VVLSEFLSEVRARGANPTEMKLRWAYKNGSLPRPRLDASHRFDFTSADIEAAVAFFASKTNSAEVASC
jgi:hypothetical protein